MCAAQAVATSASLRLKLCESINLSLSTLPFCIILQAVATSASLRLKLYKYNVTDKQDVKVVLGVDVESSGAKDGKLKRSPYFKIEENAWGLRLEKGAWQCVYQL